MATVSQPKKGSALADFVELLRQKIDQEEITISELAKKAGVGRPYLHRVLSGDHVPTIDWMEKVGKHLGISIKVTVKSL